MKCQFCNQRDADKVFYVNYMGVQYQISICQDCLNKVWEQAKASGQEEAFKNYSGWWPGKPEPRKLGYRAFPESAQEELKKERKLKVLQFRLEQAAEQEDYEEAAKLRDDIAVMKKEVCSREN